jgi:hypothetical protein
MATEGTTQRAVNQTKDGRRAVQRRIVRAADLNSPRIISDCDFCTICALCNIPLAQQSMVREFLGEVVTAFGGAIANRSAEPTRQDDRRAMERAIKGIRRAKYWLRRNTGSAGARGLHVAGRNIAPALSAAWMRARFPHESDTPAPLYWPPDDRSDGRQHARLPARPADVDELSLDQRIDFMQQHAREGLLALLHAIAAALEDGRRAIVRLPDGRKPLTYRTYLLAALAELWHRLGRRPTAGARSKFGAFCEAVCEAIGWPTEGVNAAVPRAIKDWRRLYPP